MTTQTQDTHPQDPIDRFTLRIEGLRRMPVPRGVAGVVHLMFVEFFVALWTALARFAERCRNGTLAELAPVAARESRAWSAELRPRESGWVEQRGAEAGRGGGTSRAPLEQPEIKEPIVKTLVVERPAAPPSRVRARQWKVSSGPAPARPQHVDDCCWPRRCGAGLLCATEAVSSKLFLEERALVGVDICVHFVTI